MYRHGGRLRRMKLGTDTLLSLAGMRQLSSQWPGPALAMQPKKSARGNRECTVSHSGVSWTAIFANWNAVYQISIKIVPQKDI
jgi:hypothetical protein